MSKKNKQYKVVEVQGGNSVDNRVDSKGSVDSRYS